MAALLLQAFPYNGTIPGVLPLLDFGATMGLIVWSIKRNRPGIAVGIGIGFGLGTLILVTRAFLVIRSFGGV